MGEPKPMASLSSSLLARKGHARPAMRPQGFGGFGGLPQAVEDLGWNDMGVEPPPPQVVRADAHDDVPAQPLPPVLRQREQLVGELIETNTAIVPEPALSVPAPVPAPVAEPAEIVPIKPRRVADATLSKISRDTGAKKDKAAFTLRLDAERHLRLRLACAVSHSSAQILVTEALDRFLATMPEIDELASRLPTTSDR